MLTLASACRRYGNARARRCPGSCVGIVETAGTAIGILGAGCAPAAIVAWVTGVNAPPDTKLTKLAVFGSSGGLGSATLKLSAAVRSPLIARRQGVICVSVTPKRFSMNWMTEV